MSKRPQSSILQFFSKKSRTGSDSCEVSENFTLPNVSSQPQRDDVVANVLPETSFTSPCENSADIECTSTSLNNVDVPAESFRSDKCIVLIPEASTSSSSSEPHAYDIGVYVGKDLSNEKKLDVLNNVWEPNPGFVFPTKGKRNLRFQFKWLYRWKWLAYSEFKGGSFCKFCALFAPSDGVGSGKQPLGQLCSVKFDNWKDAVERFSEHEKCLYHKQSLEVAGTLADISCGKKSLSMC